MKAKIYTLDPSANFGFGFGFGVVDEFFLSVKSGIRAGHCLSDRKPPKGCLFSGYSWVTEKIEFHPMTSKYLGGWQRWLLLTPYTVNTLFADLYLSRITQEEALLHLKQLQNKELAEKLLDCFNRGECRALFCSEEDEAY